MAKMTNPEEERQYYRDVNRGTDESKRTSLVSCQKCDTIFSSEAKFKAHYDYKHSKRYRTTYQCSHCKYSTNDRWKMTMHERCHTGDKPHVCQVCERPFSRLDALKQHLNRHTLETPYVCSVCGQGFYSRSGLSRHRFKHMDATEYPIQCTQCGKTFTGKYHLKSHLVTHTHEKNYACDLCGGKYARRNALTKHKRKVHGATASSSPPVATASTEQD
ncbi:hypothetical protein HPB50_002668 [Hyalomma asiaticum]|uniref:Uncharacterized protein n=1 Tax=Hyalomma asiaticum TaxID=266040 RepID=A0ACB7SK92_HYAAI|nr:hypothetical protein HPB50_002668 [Hyalomma asiaticum]